MQTYCVGKFAFWKLQHFAKLPGMLLISVNWETFMYENLLMQIYTVEVFWAGGSPSGPNPPPPQPCSPWFGWHREEICPSGWTTKSEA